MKKEILVAAAVKLYEVGTVSQERGAKMAYQGLSLGKNYLGFRFPPSKQKKWPRSNKNLVVSKLEFGRDQIKKWPFPMNQLAVSNGYKSPRGSEYNGRELFVIWPFPNYKMVAIIYKIGRF